MWYKSFRKNIGKKRIFLVIIVSIFFLLNINSVLAVTYATIEDVYGIMGDGTGRTGVYNITFQVRGCDDSACSGESWSANYINATYTSLAALTNNTYFQYKATFFTEDQNYTPMLFNVSINYDYDDVIFPEINFTVSNPVNDSGVTNSFTINASIYDVNLANITLNWNGTLFIFHSTNESLTNLGGGNWTLIYNQTNLTLGNTYYYQLNITDLANNKNSTEIRTIKGNSFPSLISIVQDPNITDYGGLDPNRNIIITVNVSDTDNNFDTAILQWHNMTDSDWNNITMANISEKNYYTILNASLPLPSYETNITFRVWTNDTAGGSSNGSLYVIKSYWDCTWTITQDLSQAVGWDENKWIGNITINNTGDSAYATNNCSLSFHLVHDLLVGRIYFNNWASNQWLKYYDPPAVQANSTSIITVNATFLSETKQDNAVITTVELNSISETSSSNTTAVILSNRAGPYLYQTINSYPSGSIYLTPGNISLGGYMRNLMGSSTVNESNTAYNVSFYWASPSGLTNVSGNLSMNFTNITDNNLNYLDISASFSDLDSMSPGTQAIYLYTRGYNLSGSLITYADNATLLTNSVNLTFLCYNVSDGIYVTACGSLDGDYVSTTVIKTIESAGSGGAGGGAPPRSTELSKADFEVVRGKTNTINIPFVNRYSNATLTDLRFSLSGDLAKYIELSQSSLDSLNPKGQITLVLKITSPKFIPLGKQALELSITGLISGSSYNERRTIILQVNDISRADAESLISEAEHLIEKFKAEGFSDPKVDSLLSNMKVSFDSLDYTALQDSHKQAAEIINNAFDSKKIIAELKALIAQAQMKGIDISESEKLLSLAELSFSRNDFANALLRAKDAQAAFAIGIKGESASSMYYLKYKTKEVIISAMFIFFSSFVGYKAVRINLIRKRIKKLKEEERILESLIKLVQVKTFKEKKMMMEEYRESMDYYEKKLSETIESLIELEEKRISFLKFKSNETRLISERKRISEMIHEIQNDYFKKNKMETRAYEIRLEGYSKRLGYIDEAIAALEAKKALNKK